MSITNVTLLPIPASIATPSRDSISYTSTKGLLNGPGQNNCFLNSAVQVLWHLDIFRRSFRDLSGHACMAESCIFCALKELFSQLQYSTETALPPDTLRRALAETFFDQNRFQLGFMDDAAECFENMLMRIHAHIAQGEAEDMCNARHCIPHQKFAMTLVEQSVCESCGATSEPLSYTQMVHYVSTSSLVYQARTNAAQMNSDPFGELVRKAGNMGDIRTCPSNCGAVIQIGRSLTNRPEIVSIGLVWNSERPTLEHIMEVFSTIGTSLCLGDVFNTVDSRWGELSVHNLVGVVTYYGKHYSTFFFHTKLRIWIYFDDATVREVGPKWEQVVDKCRKGRYQPLLLLYALPDGTPVNTENAPKQITPLVTDRVNKKHPQLLLRRSVTPSPEKPTIGSTRRAITPNPGCQNDYQNLSVIQNNIKHQDIDTVDGCLIKKEPDYITRKLVHRTLSNSSSLGLGTLGDGINIPDHLNIPRRRDSGNWSGDRNSASSASSTTMENPYLYLIGKVPSTPGSPTRSKPDYSSAIYDAGYDSYSLSSNDSSTVTTLQHLIKMGHLAKIPEDYNNTVPNQNSLSCDVLCDEADELLVKSRQLEDEHDLVLALALCNAAATKARAAMNAPYNNPQTLTLARMKHNTCIMRARSLHRRMNPSQTSNDRTPEIRHTREGSSGSGRHSRQNSRDKTLSKDVLMPDKQKQQTKSIEIYATLPKKNKDVIKNKLSRSNNPNNSINLEDEEFILYDKPPVRESRSIFSRKSKEQKNNKEKRSRSEDRNKLSRGDFSIAPDTLNGKDTLKKAKEKEEDKKDKDGKAKKQHKIRRKLLMGGLIKRKNRSMPDLTDTNSVEDGTDKTPTVTVDDSNLGLKASQDTQKTISGYLSEGHLEFSGNSANPNLERSKLMRKSFHGSAGKILTMAKVPPPPPLRTTSQLSKTKLTVPEVDTLALDTYPHYKDTSFSDDSFYNSNSSTTTVITQAEVHREEKEDSGVDEVDCLPNHIDLPPYPSPLGSVIHSRQASEEFPPPPPPLDLSALDEHLGLMQLEDKPRDVDQDLHKYFSIPKSTGSNWLKELQAKQAIFNNKKSMQENEGIDVVNTQRYISGDANKSNKVKDLASKFEVQDMLKQSTNNGVISMKKRDDFDQKQIAEELREVEMINAAVQKTLGINTEDQRRKLTKKKSVSFCDQVILVATADEEEDDGFIPNPILERVLRTAMNQPETDTVRQEIMALREKECNNDNTVENEEIYVKKNPEIKQVQSQSPQSLYGEYCNQNNGLIGQQQNVFMQHNPSVLYQKQQNDLGLLVQNRNQNVSPQNLHIPYVNTSLQQVQRNHIPQPHNQNTYNTHQLPHQYQKPSTYDDNYAIRQLPYQPIPQNSPSYYNYNKSPQYHHQIQTPRANNTSPMYQTYQRVPMHDNYQRYQQPQPDPYQRVPHLNQQYQRMPYTPEGYQRVPNSPYQHVPVPASAMAQKKSVSFLPGTKGGELQQSHSQLQMPKAVITPIVVNNSNNKKCNLCGIKNVVASNLYCQDCKIYMSRFKAKS